MGREQKRKNAKKYGKSMEEIVPKDDKGLKKYIKLTLIILLILGLVYFFIAVLITKEIDLSGTNNNNPKESEKESLKSNTILAKNTFRQTEESYYVYYYDYTKEISEIENSLVNLGETKIYRVNTKDALNSNYVKDTSNPNAKTLEELQVVSPTLIKVENDIITGYYETKDNILMFISNN